MLELSYKTRIYYDDTDAGGVVYYANYLKLCERAKQEFFLLKGCDLFKLHYEGIYLVVRSVKAEFIKSLYFGDEVEVYVGVEKVRKASIQGNFEIRRAKDKETVAKVWILSAAVDRSGKIVRLPECLRSLT